MTARRACLAALVAAVLAPAVALAQPDRDLATVCATDPTGDDLVACGKYYLDEYNRDPAAPNADTHLYNAGAAYAEGKAIGSALAVFAQLRQRFPRSKLDARALARVANLHASIAMYDRAAAALEEYARKYAGEKDAFQAMSDAVYYRRALGDHAKAIEDTKYFVRTFGTKRPQEAADAELALAAIYEQQGDRDAARRHLQSYVRVYGRRGGTDKLVIALAKLGQLVWEDSCPVKPSAGACVRVSRARRPAVCDPSAPPSVELVRRDERKTKEALAALAQAVTTFEAVNGAVGGDEAGARYYYARARLARIDAEAEGQLGVVAPRGARLESWLSEQVTRNRKLAAQYADLLRAKDVATSIVVASRLARLSDVLANALVTSGTKQSECDQLARAAAPLRAEAIDGYEVCLVKASELGWFEEDGARSCERALARLAGAAFPPLRERIGAATMTAPVIVLEPAVPSGR